MSSLHWDEAYGRPGERSWFQKQADPSLAALDQVGLDPAAAVVDVGGGASPLVDGLLDRGHRDVTVLDVSQVALDLARARLGERADAVEWLRIDLLTWAPSRRYGFWHDRAVFHFLTDPAHRARYRELLAAAVAPGGHVLVATFAPDGPTHCSGLPVARYDAVGLAVELGSEFAVVRADREQHRRPDGGLQPFTWLLLRHGG